MAIKSISTRASICGRGSGAKSGSSAVEQSSYIARQTMYNEYDGKTYYPKYSEDLVHSEVMLPDNAPPEYKDASVLWNAVEMNEKSANAQLARVYKFELPNEWSYELATEVVKDYMKRNFVDEGMCCQFAIHDSENPKTGQRNLHCHALLTLRGIDENGKWMPKQKKEYLLDENGERIPLIDKKTGKQKVDKQNRKQWKCRTVSTNDWSSKDNAKKWRKDLVDTINAVNEKMGMQEHFWEHRSFKDRGLDIMPQIHLGEKASAMERAGIPSIRGEINRGIIKYNAMIMQAKSTLQSARKSLEVVKAIPIQAVKNIKNEIVDMMNAVLAKKNRLSLPINKGEYISKISKRDTLQDKDYLKHFLSTENITTFEELESFRQSKEKTYKEVRKVRDDAYDKIERLEELLEAYGKYEPYIKVHKESESLKGFKKTLFDRKHIPELENYKFYKNALQNRLRHDEKITPMKWRSELKTYKGKIDDTQSTYGEVVSRLASVDVLMHNKKELDRMLENERHQREKSHIQTKETSL